MPGLKSHSGEKILLNLSKRCCQLLKGKNKKISSEKKPTEGNTWNYLTVNDRSEATLSMHLLANLEDIDFFCYQAAAHCAYSLSVKPFVVKAGQDRSCWLLSLVILFAYNSYGGYKSDVQRMC